ncbi:MAG: hypothetical protein QM715_18615 [Nibricoccus sp.]
MKKPKKNRKLTRREAALVHNARRSAVAEFRRNHIVEVRCRHIGQPVEMSRLVLSASIETASNQAKLGGTEPDPKKTVIYWLAG